jgi:phenylacetic acid degradation protein
MGHYYEYKGFVPVVPEDSFVHPQAVLIGNVILGHGCYIGPGASLRGDFGLIEVGDGANVQDNCIMHSFPGRDAIVEEDGHIGHGAILHGCLIGRNSLIGMNSVVMDGVELGENSIIGAQAFVKAGTIIPPRSMVVGAPAKVIRQVSDIELEWKTKGTKEYQILAQNCLAGLKPVQPLREVEAGRTKAEGKDIAPLVETKRNKG